MKKQKIKNMTINIALLVTSLIITILAIELILSKTNSIINDDKKITLSSDKFGAHCYSSNPSNYFPINLRSSSETEIWFQQIMGITNDDMKIILQKTPFCIVYEGKKRREGPFPKRETSYTLVGDSFTFGEGLKYEDTLAYLLSIKINTSNFKNMGNPGSDVAQVYRNTLHIKDTNGVIYFYNLNDVLMSDEILEELNCINDLQNIRLPNSNEFKSSKSYILNLIKKSAMLREKTSLTVNNYLDMYLSKSNENEFNETIKLIVSINQNLKEKGISFQLVIYPLLHKNDIREYPFKEVHNLLLKRCNDLNISCTDGYPAFDRFHSLKSFIAHPIDYHPNGKSNRLIVDYLVDNSLLIMN